MYRISEVTMKKTVLKAEIKDGQIEVRQTNATKEESRWMLSAIISMLKEDDENIDEAIEAGLNLASSKK